MRRSIQASPLVLLILAGFVLSGCGESTSPPDAVEPPPQRDSADEPSVDAAPVAAPAPKESSPVPQTKSSLLVELPADLCNTPGAMTLLSDGNVILSVPNFNDAAQTPLLMKITSANDAMPMIELPGHPDTNKPIGPMGICATPAGDLFFADYQREGERQSRLMRIVMKDGLPSEIVPAVLGLRFPNAVAFHDDHLYISETQIDPAAKPATSGVFRIARKEIDTALIKLADKLSDDPHMIVTIETRNEQSPYGAAGLAFDDSGNLYISNLGDGTIHRINFDDKGEVASNAIFAKAEFMKSAAGLCYDPKSAVLYVADPKANAVRIVSPDGSVQTLADSDETDGLDGGLDGPIALLLRGRELIVSNMDWPDLFGGKYDKPCTLSVIKLAE